ncbi:hypothetical protein JK205_02265 [Gluconobacter cerinus]|uniref:hypothetical protein n=1 Tax=Gluconobacter cerinus TaxID=38307 RepID=UPI001B8C5CEC|nr:hypothetical protein [Gluconobacter cerinus]MBS1017763.1 hypothetical protein [Gluconobacter cerinus]
MARSTALTWWNVRSAAKNALRLAQPSATNARHVRMLRLKIWAAAEARRARAVEAKRKREQA